MAKSSACRNGGEKKDSKLANHSSVHSESSVVGSLSSISPPRRQSARLKGINAVYESIDAHNSKLYQPNTSNHSFVTDQIKAEILHEESNLNDNCKRRCIPRSDLDSSSNTDEHSIITMTLKDFRARCKAKKLKSLKHNASMSTALKSQPSSNLPLEKDHSSERPDEDPDLNLPLISLKLEVMKKSSPPGRKRSHLSPSERASCVGKINASRRPVLDICSKAKPSEGGEEDSQALTRKNFIEINNSIPPAVELLKIDPELINVKNEILENGSLDACISLDAGENSSLGIFNKCQEVHGAEFSEESIFSANRFQELHANNSTGINGHDSSPKSLVQTELNDHAANPEVTCSIKSETLDAHSQEHERKLSVVNPSNADFIAKFSCPVNMPVVVDGGDESDLQMEEINCYENKLSECFVNEASVVHMKHKYNCLADFAEDAIFPESSEPVAASGVPPATSIGNNNNGFPLEDSIHGKNLNQSNDGIVNCCYENKEIANYFPFKAIEDHENRVCEGQAELLPVCSICNDGAIDNGDNFRESQDSFGHSVPSNKAEYFGNIVDEVLSTDLLTKQKQVHATCNSRGYSENEKHGLCSQKVDQLNDRNDDHFGENGGSTNDIYDFSPIKVIEDCGIVVSEEQAKELPMCSINDPTIDSSASYRKFHGAGASSPTDNSVDSLDNMVDDVHRKEVPAYCNKRYCFSHAGGHLENGTYDLCSQQLNVCSSNGSISQITSERLHETELVSATSENILNYYGSKTDCNSDEFTRVIDTEVVRVAVDDHSSQLPTPCLGSFCLLRLVDDSSSEAVENILPSTSHSETNAAVERSACPPEILPKDDSPKTEFNLDQSTGGLEHTPEKLLSNRKTISPTSQEKLCQAVNGVGLSDALQSSKTRKRLWYENSPGNEIPSTLSGSKETKPLSCSDRMTKKPKSRNDSLPSTVKGILKSADAFNRSPCTCMESSLAKKQTQKAIEFSQQQMHDIEGVAMKLLKGLKSMKSIVQRNMLSEDSLPMTSNLRTDEVRAALDNASTLEGYTKRWLTIMARDCNRFCKIMKGDKKAASPVDGVHKEGKKISFADEAGGLLCHVKVFE